MFRSNTEHVFLAQLRLRIFYYTAPWIRRICNMDNKLIITKKHLQGEDGYKVFSIRMNKETFSELEEISAKMNRSKNEIINLLITYALQNYKTE